MYVHECVAMQWCNAIKLIISDVFNSKCGKTLYGDFRIRFRIPIISTPHLKSVPSTRVVGRKFLLPYLLATHFNPPSFPYPWMFNVSLGCQHSAPGERGATMASGGPGQQHMWEFMRPFWSSPDPWGSPFPIDGAAEVLLSIPFLFFSTSPQTSKYPLS